MDSPPTRPPHPPARPRRPQVVADSRAGYVIQEGSSAYYIPRSDMKVAVSPSSGGTTFCPWKGNASYWDIKNAGGQTATRRWECVMECPGERGTVAEQLGQGLQGAARLAAVAGRCQDAVGRQTSGRLCWGMQDLVVRGPQEPL